MKIKDYNVGDEVEVLINNPRNDNKDEWRSGEIIEKRMIYPKDKSGGRPYPILIVRTTRTYCLHTTPIYRWVDYIPIFVEYEFEFFDIENDEGFLYENEIRLKPKL